MVRWGVELDWPLAVKTGKTCYIEKYWCCVGALWAYSRKLQYWKMHHAMQKNVETSKCKNTMEKMQVTNTISHFCFIQSCIFQLLFFLFLHLFFLPLPDLHFSIPLFALFLHCLRCKLPRTSAIRRHNTGGWMRHKWCHGRQRKGKMQLYQWPATAKSVWSLIPAIIINYHCPDLLWHNTRWWSISSTHSWRIMW